MEINSIEYWNLRFETDDWELLNGKEQSEDFMKNIIKNIPKKTVETFNGLDIMDFGCAIGSGTNVLKKKFKNSQVTGIDFAWRAVNKAVDLYSDVFFEEKTNENFDIVICSNVLQLYPDYMDLFKNMFKYSERYCIFLVPFEEDISVNKEHFSCFTESSFPESKGAFKKILSKKVKCKYWMFQQLLVVYKKDKRRKKKK